MMIMELDETVPRKVDYGYMETAGGFEFILSDLTKNFGENVPVEVVAKRSEKDENETNIDWEAINEEWEEYKEKTRYILEFIIYGNVEARAMFSFNALQYSLSLEEEEDKEVEELLKNLAKNVENKITTKWAAKKLSEEDSAKIKSIERPDIRSDRIETKILNVEIGAEKRVDLLSKTLAEKKKRPADIRL